MIKYFLYSFILFTLALVLPAEAQSSGQVAFNQAANYFIEGQNQQALQTVNNALKKNPNDAKLQALKKKLEEQQKQQQQQQQNQQQEGENQEQEDGQPKDSEGQNEEDKEKQEGENQEKEEKEGEGKEEEKEGEEKENGQEQEPQEAEGQEGEESEDGEDGMRETEKRLQEMNISPEKARMILEAMKSNEIQYLQQKKRKPSSRSRNGKPDW